MDTQIYPKDDILNKYDSVLAILNIIKSIDINEKLYIEDAKLCRHPYSSTRALTRWWNNYNRSDCQKFITEVYEEISEIIILMTSISTKTDLNVKKRRHKKIKKAYKKRKDTLIAACGESKKGLLHLMMTYNKDANFSEFINNILSIIDKMD